MKITKAQLKQIIKEELETIKEYGIDPTRHWEYNRDLFFSNGDGHTILALAKKEFGAEHNDAIHDAFKRTYDELARDLYGQSPDPDEDEY
jgi:hypothetical protein